MEFFPRYGDKTGIPGQEGKYLPADFSLDFKIKSNSVVTNLDVSHQEMTYEQNEDGTEVSITIEMCETVVAKDIVISYSSEQIRQPQLTLTKCAKFPGEVAAHISFIPRSSEEHEVEDEEIKHTDANVTEVDDHDDPEVANGEFIFILDRSGSMSGSRIKLAVEALELFIKSIPSNSKFNVVSFGSSYRFMFDESKEYNNENMQDALDQIKHFKSDFGGTELYMPIEKTVSMNQDFQCPRNVFVLTDGGISDTQRVLDKIREFNFATRVHSFGIGSGASAYLVKEIAKEGKGTSTLIADNDPHLKGKVIKALKLASKPAFTNLRIDWQDNAKSVKLCTPAEPYVPNVYEEEPFHVYAILKEEDLAASSVAVTLFNTHEQTEDTVVLQIPAEIAESADGQDFQLAAKHFIEYASRKNSEVSEQEVERVSVKYSVLCSKTAFFGKVKNKTKPTEEMETIQIPIKKLQKERFNDFDGMIGSRLQCMSKRSVGMTRLIDKSENLCLSSQQFSTKTKKKGGIFSAIGSAIGSIFGGSDEIERDMCPKRVSARCPSKQAVLSRAYQGQDDLDSYEECEKMSTPEYKSKNEQEYSKQSLSSSKASSSASSGYTEVTDFQDSVGFFAGLPAKFAHLLDAAVPESVLESLYDKADAQRVWVTILALAVLKKHFADLEDEWTMMAKKAEAYLKSMHVKKYKQEVKNSIAIV
uniref:VWFA domain-containing protein n=1 Tax=Euplotes harpa TaxID=151035 RepID=A0A7S3J1X8_9SPIT|mmetsp:Transcript_1476/g.1721  ORF Transcript_1476/g.1721 Transcript_1476/m.1721 type:complete len:701 (+) Transcript_1476:530-2632(+)